MVQPTSTVPAKTGWRVYLGVVVLAVGFACPLLIPVVTASDLATQWKTLISGALAVGIPEIFSIVAIAIMGKEGYNLIKARVFGFLKKHGPPDRVSRTRYRIGLIMFAIPVLFGWLTPYIMSHIPGYVQQRFLFAAAGDLLLIASLFTLGGDFWDKIRALFVYDSRVLPTARTSLGTS